MMSEFAAVATLVACTGGFIAAGVAMGTHYIDRALSVESRSRFDQTPLVRPSRPSGMNWQANDAS